MFEGTSCPCIDSNIPDECVVANGDGWGKGKGREEGRNYPKLFDVRVLHVLVED